MSFWDKVEPDVKRSLRASERDGFFWAVMAGFGENFVQPFAIFLRATNLQIAALASVPQLVSALLLPHIGGLTDRLRMRKRIVLTAVVLQAWMWLPILVLPALMGARAVPLLVLLYTIYLILARFSAPAWISWMGDLVPESVRGEYFGHRNLIIQLTTVCSTLVAGSLLGLFEERSELLGFGLLFVVAFLARMASAGFLRQVQEPAYVHQQQDDFTLRQFVGRLPSTTYGRFVIFNCLLRLATAFSAPFFALYMLHDLGLGYGSYTLVIASSTFAKVFTMQQWGRIGDRFGNRRVLGVTALLIPVVPMLWLLSTRVWWLVLIELFAGLAWGGYDLAGANFLFDAVRPAKRVRVFAFHETLHGICLFLGAMAGGLVSTRVPQLSFAVSPLQTIFLLSGLLRLLAVGMLLHTVKEVRVIAGQQRLPLPLVIAEPMEDILYGAFHGMRHGAKLVTERGVHGMRRGFYSVDRIYHQAAEDMRRSFRGKKA